MLAMPQVGARSIVRLKPPTGISRLSTLLSVLKVSTRLQLNRSSRREHSFMAPREAGRFSDMISPDSSSTRTCSAVLDTGRSSACASSCTFMLRRPRQRSMRSRSMLDRALATGRMRSGSLISSFSSLLSTGRPGFCLRMSADPLFAAHVGAKRHGDPDAAIPV